MRPTSSAVTDLKPIVDVGVDALEGVLEVCDVLPGAIVTAICAGRLTEGEE
jgi:hypothetical protein